MTLIIITTFVLIFVILAVSGAQKQKKEEQKLSRFIANILIRIEKSPTRRDFINTFTACVEQSEFFPSKHFYETHYDQILRICHDNTENVKIWQTFAKIMKRLDRSFALSWDVSEKEKKKNRRKNLNLFLYALSKEQHNLSAKQEMISIISTYKLAPNEFANLIFTSEEIFEFVKYWFKRSFIKYGQPDQKYVVSIPVDLHSMERNEETYKFSVQLELIYFKLEEGNTEVGNTNLKYDLMELFQIYQSALLDQEAKIFINWISRDLKIIYDSNHPFMLELSYIKELCSLLKNSQNKVNRMEQEICNLIRRRLIELYKQDMNFNSSEIEFSGTKLEGAYKSILAKYKHS